MNTQRPCFLLMVLFLLASTQSLTLAGQPFYDDFEDGSATDQKPVTWSIYPTPFDAGKAEVINGSLVLTPSTEKDPYPSDPEVSELDMVVTDQLYHNISVETVVRATGPNTWIAGIGALDTFINHGKQGKGVFGLFRDDGLMSVNYGSDSDISVLGQFNTGLNFVTTDVHLKLDVVNDRVMFSSWAEGSQPPANPQISRQLPIPVRPLSYQGRAIIASLSDSETPDGIAFRYVSVVPEPSMGGLSVIGLLGLVRSIRRRLTA